jgi:hypothetical protein
MRAAGFAFACLAFASLVCGCTTEPRSFADECKGLRAQFASASSRVLSESSPQKQEEVWQASSSYEFDQDPPRTLGAVKRAMPKEYHIVRETADMLDFARTESGDSVYVSVQFSPSAGGKTRVMLLVKSLPS